MFIETRLFICVLIITSIIVNTFHSQFHNNYSNQFILVLLPLLWPGLAHGSLDLMIAKRLKFITNKVEFALFISLYVFLAVVTIFFWLFFPDLFIVGFLIISFFHFGISDSFIHINGKLDILEIMIRGLIPIVVPIYFYAPEVTFIFSVLLVDPSFSESINLINTQLLHVLLALIIFSFYRYKKNKILNKLFLNYFYEVLFLIFCFIFFEPIISFGIYFCFLHSLRHLFFEKSMLELNYINLFKETLPITIISIILISIFYYLFLNTNFDYSFLPLVFVSLAALTVPHMILISFSK